jgi:hypothetical protein
MAIVALFPFAISTLGQTPSTNEWTLEVSGESSSSFGIGKWSGRHRFTVPKDGIVQAKGVMSLDMPRTRTDPDGTVTTILSWMGTRRVVTLTGRRTNSIIRFKETWEPQTQEMALKIEKPGSPALSVPPVKVPVEGGKREFEMPLRDGETFVLRETMAGKPFTIRYTLHSKANVTRKPKINIAAVKGVPELKMQKKNDCWAVAATMMVSWKEQQSLQVRDVLRRVDPKFQKFYDDDKGIHQVETAEFAKQLGMKTEPPMNYSLEGLLAHLRASGPLAIIVDAGDGNKVHEVIVIGAKGDGTGEGTEITYIEPLLGMECFDTFSDFVEQYESGDPNWRMRAIHF